MSENDSMWINIDAIKNIEKVFPSIAVLNYIKNKIDKHIVMKIIK